MESRVVGKCEAGNPTEDLGALGRPALVVVEGRQKLKAQASPVRDEGLSLPQVASSPWLLHRLGQRCCRHPLCSVPAPCLGRRSRGRAVLEDKRELPAVPSASRVIYVHRQAAVWLMMPENCDVQIASRAAEAV